MVAESRHTASLSRGHSHGHLGDASVAVHVGDAAKSRHDLTSCFQSASHLDDWHQLLDVPAGSPPPSPAALATRAMSFCSLDGNDPGARGMSFFALDGHEPDLRGMSFCSLDGDWPGARNMSCCSLGGDVPDPRAISFCSVGGDEPAGQRVAALPLPAAAEADDPEEGGGVPSQQDCSQSSAATALPQRRFRALSPLTLPTQTSLDLMSMGSQDISTPVEQKFHFGHDVVEDDLLLLPLADDPAGDCGGDGYCLTASRPLPAAPRSHAPSPERKRPRQRSSDGGSGPLVAPEEHRPASRSSGESSLHSGSKALHSTPSRGTSGGSGSDGGAGRAAGGGGGSRRPPMAPAARVVLPPALRNPYLDPDGKGAHLYTDQTPRADPKQSRYTREYKTEAEIGHGRFGVVLRAVHRQQGRAFAIKRSRRTLVSLAEKNGWIAEIHALAAVEGHPNVLTMYDSWADHDPKGGEHMYIKTELCGESLAAALKRLRTSGGGRKDTTTVGLPEELLQAIFAQMCAALSHVHGLGLAHLDFKPDNIYSTPKGVYKLGDFGLATAKDGSLLASAALTEGDTRYLAPELLRNSYDGLEKADMFALGVTMFELATGMEMPTGGPLYQQMRQGVVPQPCPGVSAKLQAIIQRLLSPDPKLRPSADEVTGWLQGCGEARKPVESGVTAQRICVGDLSTVRAEQLPSMTRL